MTTTTTDHPNPKARMRTRPLVHLLGSIAALVVLSACTAEAPSADGTIVDLHLTQASVQEECVVSSAVPYVENCAPVARPDHCFAYVEAPDGGFVRAEVWCDVYADLKVGRAFSDGTGVIGSECAYKDHHGRWETMPGEDDCAAYADGPRTRERS